MRVVTGNLRIINWNVGGAKYLELKSRRSPEFVPPRPECRDKECTAAVRRNCKNRCREAFRSEVNDGLRHLVRLNPDVITLQEVVRYEPSSRLGAAKDVIDPPEGYRYIPMWLIDTVRHGARGKWNKVIQNGDWAENAFFAQGNAILIRETNPIVDGIGYFPVWSLPKTYRDRNDFHTLSARSFNRWDDPPGDGCMEAIQLEPGMYFGDRDTEPRAALAAHLVLSGPSDGGGGGMDEDLQKPLDVFVVNLHLTTLMGEREGIPGIDEEAAQTRLQQLDTVLNKIVSQYNQWRRDEYRIRGRAYPVRPDQDTIDRQPPIWVIAGDFNFTPEAVEYHTMLRRGFIDLMPKHLQRGLAHHQATKAKGPGNKPTITLDYLFAGPRLAALDPDHVENGIQHNTVDTTNVIASDHYPLIANLPISVEED